MNPIKRPVSVQPEALKRIMEKNHIETTAQLGRRLGLSPEFCLQVRDGNRGASALYISRMWSELGVPFNPGQPDSLYRFTEAETAWKKGRKTFV